VNVLELAYMCLYKVVNILLQLGIQFSLIYDKSHLFKRARKHTHTHARAHTHARTHTHTHLEATIVIIYGFCRFYR